MRIGIGAQVGTLGGPATYARELVGALAALGRHEYVVFTDDPSAFATLAVETVHVPLRRLYQQLTWDHVRLPRLIAASRVALYHGTKNVLPWRLGVPKEFFGAGLDPEIGAAVKQAIEFYRKQGCEIKEVSLPLAAEYAIAVYYLIATAEASSNLARYDGIRYGH